MESNLTNLNLQNDKNYMEKFYHQEKLIAKIQQENLALKENSYNKKETCRMAGAVRKP